MYRTTDRTHDLSGQDALNPLDQRLTALMDAYHEPLLRVLVAVGADRDAAHDCAQETFVRAYTELRKGKDINRAWLYKVGRNLAMDDHRRRRMEDQGVQEVPPDGAANAGAAQRDARVQRTLRQLSAEEAELLYLHVVDGLKTAEIAEILGIRPTALRMRLLRARVRFRQVWENANAT